MYFFKAAFLSLEYPGGQRFFLTTRALFFKALIVAPPLTLLSPLRLTNAGTVRCIRAIYFREQISQTYLKTI